MKKSSWHLILVPDNGQSEYYCYGDQVEFLGDLARYQRLRTERRWEGTIYAFQGHAIEFTQALWMTRAQLPDGRVFEVGSDEVVRGNEQPIERGALELTEEFKVKEFSDPESPDPEAGFEP